MTIFDNHLHLSPSGRGWRAVEDFKKEGGTHIMLSHLPYSHCPVLGTGSFEKQYEVTLGIAREVREKTGVGVMVSLGPYPVELLSLAEAVGLQKAEKMMKDGMDMAARRVAGGEAHAIGEVGRPHFLVEPAVLEASNRILLYGMQKAADVGCPVVVHCESSPGTWASLASIADEAGLPRGRVVKHYSSPVVDETENKGIMPSILAGRDALLKAFKQGTRFMMETDYLDDPTRPGAVLDIRTVPKRARWLLESGISDASLDTVFRKNPEDMYGVELLPGKP